MTRCTIGIRSWCDKTIDIKTSFKTLTFPTQENALTQPIRPKELKGILIILVEHLKMFLRSTPRLSLTQLRHLVKLLIKVEYL